MAFPVQSGFHSLHAACFEGSVQEHAENIDDMYDFLLTYFFYK